MIIKNEELNSLDTVTTCICTEELGSLRSMSNETVVFFLNAFKLN